MTTFDKREEGFEKKFALDSEQTFKAGARRNKLLGLWAAEKLGLTGDAATAYSKEVSRILQQRCQSCHRPDQAAPFSLLSFDDAVKHGRMMKEVT